MRALANIDPAKFKKWLISLGVVYVLFPRDLIPDWIGRGLGLVDDAALVAFLTYFYRKRLREFATRAAGAAAGAGAGAGAGAESGQKQRARSPGAAPPKRPPDPYETLGVARSASKQEIDAAYRARMQEYHPDKVAHLGSELQDLAHRKALEIQQAYQQLRK